MTVDTLGRAAALYRQTASSRSAMALVLANLIPVVGVLFFGWSLITILVLYWVENGIVGFWNVLKIAMARGTWIPQLPDMPADAAFVATGNPHRAAGLQARWREAQAARSATIGAAQAMAILGAAPRIGLSIFFLVHYGFFWLGHGLFVFLFLPTMAGAFGPGGPDPSCLAGPPLMPGLPGDGDPGFLPGVGELDGSCESPMGQLLWGSVVLGAVALFISHGASFLFNYIGRREYLTKSPAQQMAAPYSRVVVLHLTIIFGGMVVAFLGAPIGALLVLVGLKTAFDLSLHLREHRAAAQRSPGTQHVQG